MGTLVNPLSCTGLLVKVMGSLMSTKRLSSCCSLCSREDTKGVCPLVDSPVKLKLSEFSVSPLNWVKIS